MICINFRLSAAGRAQSWSTAEEDSIRCVHARNELLWSLHAQLHSNTDKFEQTYRTKK